MNLWWLLAFSFSGSQDSNWCISDKHFFMIKWHSNQKHVANVSDRVSAMSHHVEWKSVQTAKQKCWYWMAATAWKLGEVGESWPPTILYEIYFTHNSRGPSFCPLHHHWGAQSIGQMQVHLQWWYFQSARVLPSKCFFRISYCSTQKAHKPVLISSVKQGTTAKSLLSFYIFCDCRQKMYFVLFRSYHPTHVAEGSKIFWKS